AIGRESLPILTGDARVQRWAPDTEMNVSVQGRLLLEEIYSRDALFESAANTALELSQSITDEAMAPAPGTAPPLVEIDNFAAFATARMREDTRIVALSLTGWDTHASQANAIRRPLVRLERLILQLKQGLGPLWGQTAVLAMTEFGRTVRENGSAGTDHGTGGAMLTAGGAIRGGKVLGQWPGLGESDLYAGRDLMPTGDVRSVAAWVMRGMYGLDKDMLQNKVFPGLSMGENPGILL
ncbi:MAG: DUF1501 domain-containing protein, partial [Gemmobacter sp.]|nr:DUF1501 domain-containing protein [Gemmobacter sp.]